jgi:membrane protease YdiL (CAAX protease family)
MFLKRFFDERNIPEKNNIGLALTPIFIAITLLLYEFYGWQVPFMNHLASTMGFEFERDQDLRFYAQVHTTISFFVLFVLLPIGFHRLFPIAGKNPFGLSIKHVRSNIKPYFILIVVMLPVLWFATSRPHFYDFYPIYRPTNLGDWFAYESVYLLQFFSIEFFFRGWGLFRMEAMFPRYGVFLMVLPYALIHIHKPFPEALASIVAGLVLGFLALKSRSIWPGILVHTTIAFSTDLFSLIHSGILFGWL